MGCTSLERESPTPPSSLHPPPTCLCVSPWLVLLYPAGKEWIVEAFQSLRTTVTMKICGEQLTSVTRGKGDSAVWQRSQAIWDPTPALPFLSDMSLASGHGFFPVKWAYYVP